jgi:dihydrofolate reductase
LAFEIVGHAIVSADGRIADRERRMPVALRNDKDWERFQAALDAAALVVLGRIGHAAHPNPGRRRLVVTSRVATLQADATDANATLWNPAGLPFEAAMASLGIAAGTIAVTGGQRVFDLFLPLFTRFDLVEVSGVTIPDGVPCFSSGPPRETLSAAGLHPAETQLLDPRVSLTVWRR